MQNNTAMYFVAGVVAAGVLAVLFLYRSNLAGPGSPSGVSSTTPQAGSTTTTALSGGLQVTTTGGITVKEEPVDAAPAPTAAQIRVLLDAGIAQKKKGDYAGAAKSWEQLAKLAPGYVVAFNNLGDLYLNFLPDYAKSEQNYKTVIKLQPDNMDAYYNLYILYEFKEHNTAAARAIVDAGLAVSPSNPLLLDAKHQNIKDSPR